MATAKRKQDDVAEMTSCSDMDDDVADSSTPLNEENIDFNAFKCV